MPDEGAASRYDDGRLAAAKFWNKGRRVMARIEASASHADDMLRGGIDIRYIVNCSGGTMWRPGNENFRRKMKIRRPSMSVLSSMSSKRKRIAASTLPASLFCACTAFAPAQGQSPSSHQGASIPNFSPSSTV
jgi:hypothetical protein